MKTIAWVAIALIVCVLLGLGTWYAFLRPETTPVGGGSQMSVSSGEPAAGETAASSTPMFTGYYEIERTELYTALSITITPLKPGKEPVNGIEIALGNQEPPLPEPYQIIINANIAGELQQEWTCQTLNKTTVRCGGSTPLTLGESTVLALYFARPPALPEPIRLQALHDSRIVATVEAARRER